MKLPVSLHVVTQRDQKGKERKDGERRREGQGPIAIGGVKALIGTMLPIYQVQRTLSTFIFGKVFERFPNLRIVSAENDSGWVAPFMYRMGHFYVKFRTIGD